MWFALDERLIAGVDTRLAQRVQGLRSALGAEGEIKDRGQLQQELSEFASEIPDGGFIQLQDRSGAFVVPFPNQTVFPQDSAAGTALVANSLDDVPRAARWIWQATPRTAGTSGRYHQRGQVDQRAESRSARGGAADRRRAATDVGDVE